MRRALPVAEWPLGDRQAWMVAQTTGEVFEGEERAAHWATRTRLTNEQHYGRWLGYLRWTGILDEAAAPADRVTREMVRAYNRHLETIVAPRTRLSMLVGIKVMVQAMAPERSWRWLQDACNRIQINAKPSRDKRTRMRPTAEIFAAALTELEQLPRSGLSTKQALAYRDALMLALLAARPLRVKNFSALELGRHLFDLEDGWLITIPAEETKTHQPVSFKLPGPLLSWFGRYLSEVRPLFPHAAGSSRLWLGKEGVMCDARSVYQRITKLTRRLFGTPINPHLLRDCAASSLAAVSADMARAGAPLLGHRQFSTRGQLGRVLQGRAAAGKAFGYDVVEDGERGGRVINRSEATVVERIFTMFAHGVSPRAIARRLNEEQVPGPENRPWQDTTIRGQKERGTGILNNELYIGQLVWNRCSYVKDPRTGKRVARPNPPERWERTEVPHLRIIDDALWHEVKRRQETTAFEMGRDESGSALNRAHRRRFLLSGLLTCGCCGAGYTIMAKDRYSCAGRRSKGTCQNEGTISRKEIEGRILRALKQNLLTPELVAEFTRAYQEEVNRLTKEASGRSAEIEGKLGSVQRKIDGIMRAIEDGLYQPSMKARLTELEAEKAILISSRDTSATLPKVLVHPNLAAVYSKRVEELEQLLEDTEHEEEAMERIRSLIEKIVLMPREGGGVEAILHDDLARILVLCSTSTGAELVHARRVAGSKRNEAPDARGMQGLVVRHPVSVVAGTGFEPVTFRL